MTVLLRFTQWLKRAWERVVDIIAPSPIWTTAQGKRIPIRRMTTRHLVNVHQCVFEAIANRAWKRIVVCRRHGHEVNDLLVVSSIVQELSGSPLYQAIVKELKKRGFRLMDGQWIDQAGNPPNMRPGCHMPGPQRKARA